MRSSAGPGKDQSAQGDRNVGQGLHHSPQSSERAKTSPQNVGQGVERPVVNAHFPDGGL